MTTRNTDKKAMKVAQFIAALFVVLGVIFFVEATLTHKQAVPFASETLQTRFLSFATQVSGSQRFQFATLRQNEQIEKRSSATLFWNKLQLPDVVVRATVPVEYTYYLDLNPPWQFRKTGGVLEVIVPVPGHNEPSANLSELRFEVKEGSLFRREQLVVDGLKDSMMDFLRQRANENLSAVKETGRRETKKFITQWLATSAADENITDVRIQFQDETSALAHTP